MSRRSVSTDSSGTPQFVSRDELMQQWQDYPGFEGGSELCVGLVISPHKLAYSGMVGLYRKRGELAYSAHLYKPTRQGSYRVNFLYDSFGGHYMDDSGLPQTPVLEGQYTAMSDMLRHTVLVEIPHGLEQGMPSTTTMQGLYSLCLHNY